MKVRRILQLLSWGLLLYLLGDTFMHIEWAVTKNNALTSMQKAEIDSMQDVGALKYKAKENLDVIRNVHRQYSRKSIIAFWLLVTLITVQVFLLFNRNAREN